MWNRTFPSKTALRATAVGVLIAVLGFASWVDVREARAAFFKPIVIRPIAPAYKYIFMEHTPAGLAGIEQLTPALTSLSGLVKRPPYVSVETWGLAKGQAPEAKPLSVLEAYGDSAIKFKGRGDQEKFWFLATETELAAPAPAPAKPAVNRSATLQEWYPPAADLAQGRTPRATYRAQRAVEDYKLAVGDPEFVHPAQAAMFNQRARNDSQQLAIRLIHAALEDTPEPSFFAVSTADIGQKLVTSLNRSAELNAWPAGTFVWGDLLSQEFPPAVYRWSGRTLPYDSARVVRYRVDSPLLPATVTAIDVEAYAQAALQRAESRRNARVLNSQPATSRPPFDWNLKSPTEGK